MLFLVVSSVQVNPISFNSDLWSCMQPHIFTYLGGTYAECLSFLSHLACLRWTASAKSAPLAMYLLVCYWQYLVIPFLWFSYSLVLKSLQLYLNIVPLALIQAHTPLVGFSNSFWAGCICCLLIDFLTFIFLYLTDSLSFRFLSPFSGFSLYTSFLLYHVPLPHPQSGHCKFLMYTNMEPSHFRTLIIFISFISIF